MVCDSYDYEIILFDRVDQRERELSEREPTKFPNSPTDVRSI